MMFSTCVSSEWNTNGGGALVWRKAKDGEAGILQPIRAIHSHVAQITILTCAGAAMDNPEWDQL